MRECHIGGWVIWPLRRPSPQAVGCPVPSQLDLDAAGGRRSLRRHRVQQRAVRVLVHTQRWTASAPATFSTWGNLMALTTTRREGEVRDAYQEARPGVALLVTAAPGWSPRPSARRRGRCVRWTCAPYPAPQADRLDDRTDLGNSASRRGGDCATATPACPDRSWVVTEGDLVSIRISTPAGRAQPSRSRSGQSSFAGGRHRTRHPAGRHPLFTAVLPARTCTRWRRRGRQEAMGLAGALIVRPTTPGGLRRRTTSGSTANRRSCSAHRPGVHAARRRSTWAPIGRRTADQRQGLSRHGRPHRGGGGAAAAALRQRATTTHNGPAGPCTSTSLPATRDC